MIMKKILLLLVVAVGVALLFVIGHKKDTEETFEEISVECGYSWRHVHRLHGNALRELEKFI